MSSTERVKKYRQKLHQNKEEHEKHLEKERERDRKRHDKAREMCQISKKALKRKRLNDADRQRKHKEKIKKRGAATISTGLTPDKESYSCIRSFGRAVNKVRKHLPSSPRKKSAVVKKLLLEVLPEVAKKDANISKTGKHLHKETEEKVLEFYVRDDVSCQEPGRKDVVIIKNLQTGEKEYFQKRIMITTIGEAYELFISEYPNLEIKKSKFYSLRPPYVLPVAETPHNVCGCKYHSNMQLLIDAVSKAVTFPCQMDDLLVTAVCDEDNYPCMANFCDQCRHFPIIGLIDKDNMDIDVKWQQWKDVNLIEHTGKIHNCIQEIQNQFPQFKLHCYIKRKQAQHFEATQLKVTTNTAVLQIDFAENYTAGFQDEIQSAHWHKQQVSLFTAVAWVGVCRRCFVVVSDDLNHNKYSVWVFLNKLITVLKEEFPSLARVHIFSDGSAAQFKNRYNILSLTYFQQDFGIDCTWNFFATSHGKGSVDGVGGTVKRTVWRLVKSRQCVVQCAEDFFDCARNALKGITILFTSAIEIISMYETVSSRWVNVDPVPRLQKLHSFQPVTEGVVRVAITSYGENSLVVNLKNAYNECEVSDAPQPGPSASVSIEGTDSIEVGDFVFVQLNVMGLGTKTTSQKDYFAEVLSIDIETNQVVLKYMHPSGKMWIWPKENDISTEDISVIVNKCEPPKLVNNRGQFTFK